MKFVLFSVIIIGIWVLIRANTEVAHDEIVFKKLGSYEPPGYGNIRKSYWAPRHFKAQWQLTRSICRSFGFDIVSFDTLEEHEAVVKMCEQNRDMFESFVHVGGVATSKRSKTDWYWVNSNTKVSYNMAWTDGQPDSDNEWCLSLRKDDQFKFNDISCYGIWEEKFICESVEKLGLE